MFKKMLVALAAVAIMVSSAEAQGVSVRKSRVVPTSEIEDGFDYSRCAISHGSANANERVRMPRGADFRLVVINELPLGCVQSTIRVLGSDLVFRKEILLPGQYATISVDPDAWDWERAKDGALIVGVAGALLGAVVDGDNRARGAARGALGGAAVGAVVGGAPRDRRGQRDVVQVTVRVLDETGKAVATQCREYQLHQGARYQDSHVLVVDSIRNMSQGATCGENGSSGGTRFLRFRQ